MQVRTGRSSGHAHHRQALSATNDLARPDGNGIELYRDRPREEWPRPASGEGVEMFTRPLDLGGLIEAGRG
jgi:catechol 2,3-dioxygenase